MIRSLAALSVGLGFIALLACETPQDLIVKTGVGTPYPCGTHGVVCAKWLGGGCCDEGNVCQRNDICEYAGTDGQLNMYVRRTTHQKH